MVKRLFFFLTFIVILLSACSDNDSFTTDSGHLLTFTRDTVRLDTLFATVPSSTYTFWVHNRSGDGLRINSVRLERGSQSGFRANVDGTFLNPAATNLEVRKGDSIRVFVEITASENSSNEPTLVEDNLLFNLESGRQQKVNLRTYSWNVKKITDLEVSRDTTIQSDIPLVFYGHGIHVAADATLTVNSSTLYFHDNAGIMVDGRFVAKNSVFRGDRLDHMFDYLPYDRVSGQWYSIVLNSNSRGCYMDGCEIRNSYNGIFADSTHVELDNTVIHNCRGYGLYAFNSEVTVNRCQFSNTLNDCLSLDGCIATIDHCTLAQFYPLSGNRGAALSFHPSDRGMELTCSNTLVTGYNEDVLMGVEPCDTVRYHFDNCLLRTPVVDNEETFTNIIWETSKDDIQGVKHFQLVDEENLIYDFTILYDSPAWQPAIGRAFGPKKEEEQRQQE